MNRKLFIVLVLMLVLTTAITFAQTNFVVNKISYQEPGKSWSSWENPEYKIRFSIDTEKKQFILYTKDPMIIDWVGEPKKSSDAKNDYFDFGVCDDTDYRNMKVVMVFNKTDKPFYIYLYYENIINVGYYLTPEN